MSARCFILIVSLIVLVKTQELKTNANNTDKYEENLSIEELDSEEDSSSEDLNEIKVQQPIKLSIESENVTAISNKAVITDDIIDLNNNQTELSFERNNTTNDFNDVNISGRTKLFPYQPAEEIIIEKLNATEKSIEFESDDSNENLEEELFSEILQAPKVNKPIDDDQNAIKVSSPKELVVDSKADATEDISNDLVTNNEQQEVSLTPTILTQTEIKKLIVKYRAVYDEYLVVLYKQIATRSHLNFVFSARAIWLSLAALAEGSDLESKRELFEFLRLPNDAATRKTYYRLAVNRIFPGDDVFLSSKNTLVIDDGLSININWINFISESSLIDLVSAPIKGYPQIAAREIRRVISSPLRTLDLSGNSVLLNAIDYDGLWRTAFFDATIERSPFYNQNGDKIGSVDLMKIKRRVRLNYIEKYKGKILELPIGVDSRYRMIFAMLTEPVNVTEVIQSITPNIVNDMVNGLKETDEAIDVAIPRIRITSEINMKTLLQDVNITSIWSDPAATSSISAPALLPSGYYQRATMTLNSGGLEPDLFYPIGKTITNESFIANKPFLFSLFDAETYTCLIAVGFTQPTYKD